MTAAYRFSLGPWNIGRGADPFGPPVRPAVSFDAVLDAAVALGFVGFDVKAQRTQRAESATAHLATSKAVFLRLVEKVRSFPEKTVAECIAARDYEAVERLVLEHLLGC